MRSWSASEWRSSSRAPAEKAASRAAMRARVAPLGDVGDGEQRRHAQPQTSSSPSRTSASPSTSTVGSRTTQSRWTGTWTVPPIAAEAPKATWAVPRIFSSSRMLPVRIAASLVPMPSSATLVPSSPWAVSSSSSSRAGAAPTASVRWPPRTVRVDRLLDPADAGDRAVDDQRPLAGPLQRGDEALAAGQVAEGAAGAEVAGVDDRGARLEPEPQVAAVGAGDARLGAGVERRADRLAAAAQGVDVGAHHPGQHLAR